MIAVDKAESRMEICVYMIDGQPLDIRPAAFERSWMDENSEPYAYRCLPLNIANAHGWEVLSPAGFSAVWRRDAGLDAITIIPDPVRRRASKTRAVLPLVPHPPGRTRSFESELRLLSENAELTAQYADWTQRRQRFNEDLKRPGSKALTDKWPKHYYRGSDLSGGAAAAEDHRTKELCPGVSPPSANQN